MKPNNKNKTPEIDESILDETPPNINEPQKEEEDTQDRDDLENQDSIPEEKEDDEQEEVPEKAKVDVEQDKKVEKKQETPQESSEQKEQRYKAQQTEAQIQAAKNRDLINRVDDASKIGDPSAEELKAFVKQDGVEWDELTTFEQSMAKKSYLAEKRFDLVNQAVQSTKKIDEWASKIDTFIDKTDGKPEYVQLSNHEADFRKFCMKEAHRGTPVDILLGAFLHNLPTVPKKKGSLFETGSGGEKVEKPGKITDADQVAALRTGTQAQQAEYKRLVKEGKISLDI